MGQAEENAVKTRQYSKRIAVKYQMHHQDIPLPLLAEVGPGRRRRKEELEQE